MAKRILVGKMQKNNLMLKNPVLAQRMPLTKNLNRQHLLSMLDQYHMVYVKPDTGSQGKGVIRIEKVKQGYRYQEGIQVNTYKNFNSLYSALSKRSAKHRYVVQKGIHLLKFKGRPFDFRIMIQRNPKRKWECTGTLGRLAHPGKAVTNGSQGGTICEPSLLLAPFADKKKRTVILRQMNILTQKTAMQLSKTHPELNELGLDIALDQELKPWILEANTSPDAGPFSLLSNPKIVRKIAAYGKAYGKRHRTTCSKAKKAPASFFRS